MVNLKGGYFCSRFFFILKNCVFDTVKAHLKKYLKIIEK